MMKLALLDNPPRALADASDGAGQAAAGAAVQSSGPHAHHGADGYGRWFGRGGDARKRRLAWVGALAPELKALGPAGGRVRGDAVLPGGQTVEDFAQGRLARVIQMEVRHGTEAQGKGYFALRQVGDEITLGIPSS